MSIKAKLWTGFKDYSHFTFDGNYASNFGSKVGGQFIEECGGKNILEMKKALNKGLITKDSHPSMSQMERQMGNAKRKRVIKRALKNQRKENIKLIKENYKNTSLFDKAKRKNIIKTHFSESKKAANLASEQKVLKTAENMTKKATKLGRFGSKTMNFLYKIPFLGKAMKKVGPAALIFAAFELVNLNSDAKKHNVKATGRDYAKTGVRFLAEMGGYAAGMSLGSALAAAGSVVPGVGTAIGFVAGMIIGSVAGWAAKHLTGAVLGKTNLDIAKAQEEEMNKNGYNQADSSLDDYFAQMTTAPMPTGMTAFA